VVLVRLLLRYCDQVLIASVTSLHRLVCKVIRTVRSVPVGCHKTREPDSTNDQDKAADHLNAALCPEASLALELTL
jgi:hypothetical protein